jgi:hypothetical protein
VDLVTPAYHKAPYYEIFPNLFTSFPSGPNILLSTFFFDIKEKNWFDITDPKRIVL